MVVHQVREWNDKGKDCYLVWMIRSTIFEYKTDDPYAFRLRGKEPGRLENFSDAVFALAITLLLISTSPPTNFDQIKRFTFELFPFTGCIALIVLIWNQHFVFFQRYGLRNGPMIFLNTLFLIIVLFYVYPLKFLTKIIILWPIAYVAGETSLIRELQGMIRAQDMGDLMIIYGIGAASVFFVMALMYRYAGRNAASLQLDEIEKMDTLISLRTNVLMGIIPVLSVIMAFIFRGHWLAGPAAGFTYLLYTPIMFWFGHRADRTRNALIKKIEQAQAVPAQG